MRTDFILLTCGSHAIWERETPVLGSGVRDGVTGCARASGIVVSGDPFSPDTWGCLPPSVHGESLEGKGPCLCHQSLACEVTGEHL